MPAGEFNRVDEPFVDRAYETEEEDADEAKAKSDFCYASAVERSNDGLFVGDPHSFDNTEIVVEGDYRVDKGNEHQHVECH